MNIRLPWHMLVMAAILAAIVVAGVLEIGPPASSARTTREIVTAAHGVVQSTVTGTGNVEPRTDVVANFQTSGVLQNVYVHEGDHVVQGQLLATLDPTTAQLGLDQADAQLTSAEDQLKNAEAEPTSTSAATNASTPVAAEAATQFAAYRSSQTTPQTATAPQPPSSPRTTPSTRTAPPAGSGATTGTSRTSTHGGSTPGTGSGTQSGSGSGTGTGTGSGAGGASSAVSAATKAADIASAQASVDSAEASVRNAQRTLHETHLYAPATGTVVAVSTLSAGDAVAAGSASSSAVSGSGSSSGAGATTTAGALGGSGSGAGGGSAAASSSGSSGFVEIVSAGSLMISVPFSESDISQLKVGQTANVTLEALSGVELAGHVSAISPLGSDSSGVVSYDATIAIDQHSARVKPGMSASVSVVTAQASGVNLPSSAVTGTQGSVSHIDVLDNGKTVSRPVVVGLVGSSRTQIVSGLRAGQQVVVTARLPSLATSATSGTGSGTGTLGGGRFGGGGIARLLGGGRPFGGAVGGGFGGG